MQCSDCSAYITVGWTILPWSKPKQYRGGGYIPLSAYIAWQGTKLSAFTEIAASISADAENMLLIPFTISFEKRIVVYLSTASNNFQADEF